MKTWIDMWYEDTFDPEKHHVDVFFSDTDCVYRGNIYDETGRAIGDFESPNSAWIERFFKVKWRD